MSHSSPSKSPTIGTFFENMYNIYYAICMNMIDVWFIYNKKNREAFDYTRDTSEDNIKLYMEGYEKAKQDMGYKYKPAHDPTTYIF